MTIDAPTWFFITGAAYFILQCVRLIAAIFTDIFFTK